MNGETITLFTREQLSKAAFVVIRVKPHDLHIQFGIDSIATVLPEDIPLAILKPDESLEFLSEQDMNRLGWKKINKETNQ